MKLVITKSSIIILIGLAIVLAVIFYLIGSSNRMIDDVAAFNVRDVCRAETKYMQENSGNFGTMNDLINAGFLPKKFVNPKVGEHIYSLEKTEKGYVVKAVPVIADSKQKGIHSFQAEENGVNADWRYDNNYTPYHDDGDGKPITCK